MLLLLLLSLLLLLLLLLLPPLLLLLLCLPACLPGVHAVCAVLCLAAPARLPACLVCMARVQSGPGWRGGHSLLAPSIAPHRSQLARARRGSARSVLCRAALLALRRAHAS